MKADEIIQELQRAVHHRYDVIKEYRQPGQPVMGWLCSYFPEEVLYAAGIYPVRVLGGQSTTFADAYLHINMCSLVRCCLDEGLRGEYSFLEGLVTLNTCDNMRRLYDTWRYFLTPAFSHLLPLPHKVAPDSIAYFREEIGELQERLGSYLGKKVTTASLERAIETYNRTRWLMQRLDELRRSPAPPLRGSEFMDIILAGMILPKDKYNSLLEGLLPQLEARTGDADDRPRLLLTGSELDDSQFLRLMEDSGGMVVADDLCTGSKYYWNLVEEDGDPLGALARRYLNRPPCPRMRPSDARVEHIQDMVKSHRVDGVVLEIIRFCKLQDEGSLVLRQALEEAGIPVLTLSREYSLTGTGGLKTRLEAFMESLAGI